MNTTPLNPVTITLSPLLAFDLLNIIQEFVPENDAKPTLKRLRVALRASGYLSEDELHSAAGVEIRERLANLAEAKGMDEADEDEEI